MSYQVIARKWRPQSFDQLVGQNHISQTLQNALKNGRLPHALLFTGPRGTGKTSSARILAKSLRCPNAVNFQPCNVCQECQDITASRSIDVIEIDGASNNGVDAIRELRDTVAYAPSSGKYKVYIIDEVHMLSTSAFNALLKTLEEPPAHVVFIMATTEVQKIPQTILSRCQRFDFRSISTRQIADRLKIICDKENVPAEEEALWIIARQGDGSMRDSQSLLDQVITFADGSLTRESVIGILGLTDRTLLLEVLSGLVARQVPSILTALEKIFTAGYEPSLFANNLLENIRHLLLIKISSTSNSSSANTTSIIELPDSEIRFLKDLGATTGEEDIHMLFDMCLKGAGDIAKASEPRIVLEMLLLRMAQAPRIVELAQMLSGQATAQTANTATTISRPSMPAPIAAPKSAPTATASAPQRRMDPIGLNPQEKWFEFVQRIRQADALLAAKVEHLLFLGEKEKVLSLGVPAKMTFIKDQLADAEVRKKLQSFVDQHWSTGYTFTVQLEKGEMIGTSAGMSAKNVSDQKEKKQEEDLADRVANHPLIKSATTALKGQIKSIKNPQTPSK